jgi:UDP-4-amino-4-deoxy-L-arabinose formyltransferase/UDP-glucuronic acid dehydrogenase (UDP-4-keto-hexauronic acid decarboxylating)
MQAIFGFEPKVSMTDSLRKALDFFVEEHKALEKVVETEG